MRCGQPAALARKSDPVRPSSTPPACRAGLPTPTRPDTALAAGGTDRGRGLLVRHALLDVVQRLFAVRAVRYRSELASAVLLAACSPASAVALLAAMARGGATGG